MMKRLIIRVVGSGMGLASLLWILAHLIAFSVYGYILVGEQNPVILYSEIALVMLGLTCFLIDLGDEK